MAGEFQVTGDNAAALFTLKLHRGDGMALVAMNWKKGKPPEDFVGFAIEYKEPGGQKFFSLKNRLCFPGAEGEVNPNRLSTRLSPIQKFRWVHFPRNAELAGEFVYRVSLSGIHQSARRRDVMHAIAHPVGQPRLFDPLREKVILAEPHNAVVDRHCALGHGDRRFSAVTLVLSSMKAWQSIVVSHRRS